MMVASLAVGASSVDPGCLAGDCADGTGVFLYADGARYEGPWVSGKKQGVGAFTLASGERFERTFAGGIATEPMEPSTGEMCMSASCVNGPGMSAADGSVYSGEFVGGKRHGKGTERVDIDGSTFVGQFVGGKREGLGTLTSASGDIAYEVSWAR
jgi:hypothetical protein